MTAKKIISSNDEQAKQDAKERSKNRLCSVINTACAMDSISGNHLDIPTVGKELVDGTKKIHDGNTFEIEMTLYSQAKTLDLLFNEMVQRATQDRAFGGLESMEAYFNMAFKAQNLCRKAFLAISAIKNPQQTTFVKQQNVGVNQQINNGSQAESLKINSSANELLEEQHGKRLDATTSQAAIRIDTPMETVAVGRCEVRRRQSHKQDERT